MTEVREKNKVWLRGPVYLDYYGEDLPYLEVFYDQGLTEIQIDESTGYLDQIHSISTLKATSFTDGEELFTEQEDFVIENLDFNGNFSTEIPNEIKKLAE